jgi:dienelactone hydrolase
MPTRFHVALLMALSLISNGSMLNLAHAADPRADFLKLIDRPRVPLAPEATTMPWTLPLVEFHFTYASDAHQRVPGILLKSTAGPTGRRPVVIALHGTGGNKSDMLPLMRALALRGFIAVAIDGPYHGERSKAGTGTDDYQAAILDAWHNQQDHPFFFDTVWDVMRLIDYLDTRDDVDPARIGLYGVSKGGIETYLTAAVDTRVAVAVPCIGLESFKWALDNNSWQSRIGTIQDAFDSAAKESGIANPGSDFVHQFYQKIAPGLDGEFDGPAMAPLIAPRPLMTINGDSDPRTPLPGLKLCTDAAQAAYKADNAPDHFVIRIQPNTGHNVNPDSETAAIDWFAKWLKPAQ